MGWERGGVGGGQGAGVNCSDGLVVFLCPPSEFCTIQVYVMAAFRCLKTILTFLNFNTFYSLKQQLSCLLITIRTECCWMLDPSLILTYLFFLSFFLVLFSSLDLHAGTAVLLLLLFSCSSAEDFFFFF